MTVDVPHAGAILSSQVPVPVLAEVMGTVFAEDRAVVACRYVAIVVVAGERTARALSAVGDDGSHAGRLGTRSTALGFFVISPRRR